MSILSKEMFSPDEFHPFKR